MEDSENYQSKSARKREMHALQQFALKLAALPKEVFDQLSIPNELDKAIFEYKRIKSHGAKYRQAQFLGKIMRKIDSAALIEAYEKLDLQQNQFQQQAEDWRRQLLMDNQAILNEFIQQYPTVDRQKLRQLIKNAIAERDEKKYPGAQKALYRFINSCITSQ